MKYAGVGTRFLAAVVDTLVWLPVLVVLTVWSPDSRAAVVLMTIVGCLFGISYRIGMHTKYGKTLGKMALGIEVRSLNGSKISWKHAIRRDAVDIVFSFISLIESVLFVAQMSAAQFQTYATLGWKERANYSEGPSSFAIFSIVETASALWLLSEILTPLFNEKRRALHDYIAGTVVIYSESAPERVEMNSNAGAQTVSF